MEKKRIHINAEFLGAVKQLPFLVRELRTALPKVTIDIETKDYIFADNTTGGTLMADLAREGIRDSGISINQVPQRDEPKIRFVCRAEDTSLWGTMNLPIDPLKFESRKLLDADEIAKLKAKYFIGDQKVILGGSIRTYEMDEFMGQSKKAIAKNKNTKVIVVPRNPDSARSTMNGCGVNYSMNADPAGRDTNYTLITEMGILDGLYSLCDVAVLGDTFFTGSGGQNPLEPAVYGKRIISGHYNKNNMAAYDGLKNSGLLKRVRWKKIAREAGRNVSDRKLDAQRKKAAEFIGSRQGAAKFYAEVVAEVVERGDNLTREKCRELEARVRDYATNGPAGGSC
ncbi:hypothetical protein HOA55_01675 [archaeon]|nr:hypothetical protein [archaeon]MBT3577689.1 hypothetical protein [archaeon]MBT6820044.1 hypothetical protein [archaeon]MBT6956337.1 hypothetical protein [archaeon]MBT7025355.1 hypothetical protein [archaeon]